MKIDQIKRTNESWKDADLEVTTLVKANDLERSGITHVHIVGKGDHSIRELYDMIDAEPRFKPSECCGISK